MEPWNYEGVEYQNLTTSFFTISFPVYYFLPFLSLILFPFVPYLCILIGRTYIVFYTIIQ